MMARLAVGAALVLLWPRAAAGQLLERWDLVSLRSSVDPGYKFERECVGGSRPATLAPVPGDSAPRGRSAELVVATAALRDSYGGVSENHVRVNATFHLSDSCLWDVNVGAMAQSSGASLGQVTFRRALGSRIPGLAIEGHATAASYPHNAMRTGAYSEVAAGVSYVTPNLFAPLNSFLPDLDVRAKVTGEGTLGPVSDLTVDRRERAGTRYGATGTFFWRSAGKVNAGLVYSYNRRTGFENLGHMDERMAQAVLGPYARARGLVGSLGTASVRTAYGRAVRTRFVGLIMNLF